MNDSPPIIISAVPVTDLVLVVGDGPDKERIPVESAILKAVSLVFASMLSPPWMESQRNEISLPEDDPDAMQFIMLVLHFYNNYEMVTRPRTPQEILQIAIHVDKYDLRVAMKFVLDFLFSEAAKSCPVAKNAEDGTKETMAGEDIVYLCAAAYVLDRCDWFSRFGFDLMCRHAQSFTELMNDELISSILPAKFFVLLGEKVTQFQLEILRAVHECVFSNSPYRDCGCEWAKSFVKSLESFAISYGGYKKFSQDGSTLLWGVKTIKDFVNQDKSLMRAFCSVAGLYHAPSIDEEETLAFKMKAVFQEFNVVFCICEMKSREGCNAKHANPWLD